MTGKAAPEHNDGAIALCFDAKFFPFAVFMIRQIAYRHLQSRTIITDRLQRFPDPDVAHF